MDLLNGPTPELPACERTMPRRISAGKLWQQLYDTVWIYICHAVRSLVLAVPTAGVNWQIGPCYRRNEWVGGTSALSNIKLMGRTIGASTALCMMSLPFCIFAFKLKFEFLNGTSSDSQQPCPLWIKGWLRYRRKRAWRSQLAWFTCGKWITPLEEIKYAKVRKDITSWCCNNWVEFGNKHVQLHISTCILQGMHNFSP